MLDQYFRGSVSRISPEAPVPVVKVNQTLSALGGAGNVANNLAGLRETAVLVGVTGKDANHTVLQELSLKNSIQFKPTQVNLPTITKIRVVGEHQQITRLDFEEIFPLGSVESTLMLNDIQSIPDLTGIIISDYEKGTCSPELCQQIIRWATDKKIPVFVDPKGSNWHKYEGAFVITPNLKEVEDALKQSIPNTNEAVEKAGMELMHLYCMNHLLVTRSDKGMSLFVGATVHHYPTQAIEVYDVSGAGDTVIATLAWAYCQNPDIGEAIQIANAAAGIVVSKQGTVPSSYEELQQKLHPNLGKKQTLPSLMSLLDLAKKEGKKIVFTNGCFDILHRGHVDYLRSARALGDILIVGVNSDSSIRRLKGSDRPINREQDRVEILSSLECVSFTLVFDEDTPAKVIEAIRPDVLVKGGDYKPDEVIGREHASKVEIIPFVEGYSTTSLIQSVQKGRGDNKR